VRLFDATARWVWKLGGVFDVTEAWKAYGYSRCAAHDIHDHDLRSSQFNLSNSKSRNGSFFNSLEVLKPALNFFFRLFPSGSASFSAETTRIKSERVVQCEIGVSARSVEMSSLREVASWVAVVTSNHNLFIQSPEMLTPSSKMSMEVLIEIAKGMGCRTACVCIESDAVYAVELVRVFEMMGFHPMKSTGIENLGVNSRSGLVLLSQRLDLDDLVEKIEEAAW